MTIPAAPRLRLAAEAAVRCLLEEGLHAFPVDPAAIITRRGWKLRTYSRMAARMDERATVDDVLALYHMKDAFASQHMAAAGAVTYMVCYNDRVDVYERVVFSLAHEIGHILLGHFDYGSMEDFTPAQRAVLDREASVFAANLLAPAPIVTLLRRPEAEQTRRLFGLSKAGWQARLDTLRSDTQLYSSAAASLLRERFTPYMYRRQCAACGAIFTGRDACPACGGINLRWSPAPEDAASFPWSPDTWRTAAPSDPDMLENPLADDERWHGDDRGSY